MAHALRYYKNIVQSNGRRIRIEFHEKDGTAAAMELGNVIQSLNLEIQGGGDVDEPIVKTQLNFTLVDAPDHADHKTKKCGAWEEFYSPDATHWKVLLFYKEIGESSYTQFWGGYITPDSYHEILTYRAGISFIARDNIGHLQDFPFDAEGNADGMITLYDLLMSAWAKIESPMELVTKTDGDAEWLRCEGNNALYTFMNVSAFEGKNWLEAVTEALYGYGLVMRYVGENYVYVYPLRNLAVFPFGGSGVDVQFETGAERELSPAVRRIEESAEYTIEETIARKLVQSNEYSGAVVNATIEGKNVFGETITKTAKANPLSNTSGKGWYNPSRDGAMLLNPKAYDVAQVKDFIASDMVFLLNTKNTEVVYSATINPQNINIRLAFGNAVEILGSQLTPKWIAEFSQLKYAISATQNGITQYWSGDEWTATKKELSATFDSGEVGIYCNARSFTGEVKINLHIYSVRYDSKVSSEDAAYAALNSFTFASAESPALLTTNRVNTNYIDTNNVILSRNPKIAPALNTTFMPAVIKNGIFVQQGTRYNPASLWSWKADGTGGQQMAVYNHLQLLCYHGKPNNILSGTILNADVTNIGKVYRWNNTEHILLSGTLNLISGYIEGATLREFTRYENMWGDLTDTADLPEVEGSSTNNVDGGARSGGNTATYSNTTEVNIGGGGTMVLDTYMSDSSTNGVQNKVIKNYVDTAVDSLETSLATKAKQSDLTATNTKVSANETAIADRYTKTEVDAKVKTLADSDTALGNRITPLETWKTEKDKFFAKFYLGTDGNVYCDTNLIISGDTSSGGNGGGGGTSGGGGMTDEEKEAYALKEWVTNGFNPRITSSNKLDVSLIYGLGALATKDSISWSEVQSKPTFASVATSGKYTDLSGRPNLGDLAYEDSITKSMITEALDYTPFDAANFTKDNITTKIGTTTYAPYNANGYLPKSGGTIEGGPRALMIKRAGPYLSSIGFSNSDGQLGSLGFVWENAPAFFLTDGNYYHLLHSGNYSSYALPITGGTITGSLQIGKVDNTTFNNLILIRGGHGIRINNTSVYGYISFGAVDSTGYMTAEKQIILGDNGLQYTPDLANYYNLIHSGNIGSQSVNYATSAGNADTLDGWHATDILPKTLSQFRYIEPNVDLDTLTGDYAGWWSSRDNISYTNGPKQNFGLLAARINTSYFAQLAFGYGSSNLMYRSQAYSSSGVVWSPWKTIAFTDSNVASATKLQTARTIWGQSFDGTGNVSGALSGVNSITPSAADSYDLGADGNAFRWIYASWLGASSGKALKLGANNGTHITINTSGNVGIGTTSPAYKLDVSGDIASYSSSTAARQVIVQNSVAKASLYAGATGNRGLYDNTNAQWIIYTDGTKTYIPSKPLTIAGATTLSSTLSVKESVTAHAQFLLFTTNDAYRLTMYEIDNIARLYNIDSAGQSYGYMYIGSNSANAIVVKGGSYVGVGMVPSGDYKLEIYGALKSTSVTTSLVRSSGGLDIVANYSGAGSRLWLTTNVFRPWGDDAGLIDLGASNIRWRGLYCGTGNFSGEVTIDNNLIVSGDTSSGSDIRFKDIIENKTIKIEDIANAPLFTFKWNDRNDDGIHLGSSAQYWEVITPELVCGNDFKHLNYAGLGVAMGISLANKALNHEERIKILEKENKALKEEIRRIRYVE